MADTSSEVTTEAAPPPSPAVESAPPAPEVPPKKTNKPQVRIHPSDLASDFRSGDLDLTITKQYSEVNKKDLAKLQELAAQSQVRLEVVEGAD